VQFCGCFLYFPVYLFTYSPLNLFTHSPRCRAIAAGSPTHHFTYSPTTPFTPSHPARHYISADEVEEVAFDDEPWIRKGKNGTRYLLG
jgi:hypothetical protein